MSEEKKNFSKELYEKIISAIDKKDRSVLKKLSLEEKIFAEYEADESFEHGTPLHYAVRKNLKIIVLDLISFGCDVNAKNRLL